MNLIEKIKDELKIMGYRNPIIEEKKPMIGKKYVSLSVTFGDSKSKTINLTNLAEIYGTLRMFHYDNEEDAIEEMLGTIRRP